MKEKYLELMEKALSAYSLEHIIRYFDEVKRDGLREHGFPRLTVNIGILIAHGRRTDLLELFCEMMEFCCKSIPRVKAANDFSVREIICCMTELEQSHVVDEETLARWKAYLSTIDPYTCYNVISTPEDPKRNWALFTGVSEFFRQQYGLCDSSEFIDIQLASQLFWIDENGMYKDNASSDIHQPIVYDMVPRGLFALLLHRGYRGKYYESIDAILKKTGLLMLKMQSACGEIAFGGRSNQFIHNEPWYALLMEYEAKRYAREGNMALAGAFKDACARAVAVTDDWLGRDPIRHIKNRYPTETKHGCEGYAYFDKYMITAASFLYGAYLICDDTIPTPHKPWDDSFVFETSKHFHKLFLKSGKYSAEFDLSGDPHYDASGLGRIHRCGAPSTIALSVPCPAEPIYHVSLEKPTAVSMCPGVRMNGEWHFATGEDTVWKCVASESGDDFASAQISCSFSDGQSVDGKYTVTDDGVTMQISGTGDLAFMLPALYFDGETHAEIAVADHEITVSYAGWRCRYSTDGKIVDPELCGENRNGCYKAYYACAEHTLEVRVEIDRIGA
ncbi:MAG: hypothetical protein E7463_01560 [Ruminococcaceae bacterium]|nr:hypothetical protein [Oscillospiraceae bacterium]